MHRQKILIPTTRQRGDGGDLRLPVGMRGSTKNLLGGACFHDAASLPDGDARGELRDHGQAVRNQQVGQGKFALQFLQQLEDLRADGSVECGHRLVGDDPAGTQHQGEGGADALPLASGKLVRASAEGVFSQADGTERYSHARLEVKRKALDDLDVWLKRLGRPAGFQRDGSVALQ